MNLFGIIVTYFICFFSIMGTFLTFPYISRKNISFGISIPENLYYSSEIRNVRKKYTQRGLAFGFIILIFAIIISVVLNNQYSPDSAILAVIPAVFILLFSLMVLYLNAYKEMKIIKSNSSWKDQSKEVIVIDTDFRKGKLMASPLWFVSYLLIIMVTLGLGIYFYDSAPQKIPMNFDFNGNVTNYVDKSIRVFLLPVFVQLMMLVVFIFSYWMIGKSKQQIDASNPEVSKEQNRMFRLRWSQFILFTGFIIMILFMILQLTSIGVLKNLQIVTLFAIGIPLIIVVVLRLFCPLKPVKAAIGFMYIQIKPVKRCRL
ncbi:MAG: DUF1648 domain-containing protein [Clostridium sp.]|nr:DUF1648 domain-containing protein [Clostridium sp.]